VTVAAEYELDLLADNGILRHDVEVLSGNDVSVTGGGDENVGPVGSVLHRADLVASHGGLEGVDGVDLGNENSGTVRSERFGALEISAFPVNSIIKLTPFPTSPKPATTATLPANIISVARLIPSTRDSRQPY
jgi:hypothetical protein